MKKLVSLALLLATSSFGMDVPQPNQPDQISNWTKTYELRAGGCHRTVTHEPTGVTLTPYVFPVGVEVVRPDGEPTNDWGAEGLIYEIEGSQPCQFTFLTAVSQQEFERVVNDHNSRGLNNPASEIVTAYMGRLALTPQEEEEAGRVNAQIEQQNPPRHGETESDYEARLRKVGLPALSITILEKFAALKRAEVSNPYFTTEEKKQELLELKDIEAAIAKKKADSQRDGETEDD